MADVQHSVICSSRQMVRPLELNSGTLLVTLFPPKAQLQDRAPSPQDPLSKLELLMSSLFCTALLLRLAATSLLVATAQCPQAPAVRLAGVS